MADTGLESLHAALWGVVADDRVCVDLFTLFEALCLIESFLELGGDHSFFSW